MGAAVIEAEAAVLIDARGTALPPDVPFASIAEHGGDYFLEAVMVGMHARHVARF